MKTISKFAFAAVFLSSASLFTPIASAAPFSFTPVGTQGDAQIVPAAMTRHERMMHRREMERHHMRRGHRAMRPSQMRSNRTMGRKDMTNSDAGAMTNSRAPTSERGPISPPKDMSTSDAGARNNSRAPASVRGPMTRPKDMSTTDSPR
ncbi:MULTISPECIES: hypothetical protein [unclassified Beijerinckia]|uniref:hypothetical protein n=1 Tax=unclassified Beijerinckia TaxID=2638183 RepID=UPI00089A5BC8|nr:MULTISPECIES: hypothetical protein [unclassified Beijerinckia]MDH7794680.1 hypothetical protein [Beijerinckia sp. GAS462]SEB70987.1 hypothetical protein SAMN05443249_0954 [Beijerinckia sp. 28-YEA-48]